MLLTFRLGQAVDRLASVSDYPALRLATVDLGLAPADLRRQLLRRECATEMQLVTGLEFDQPIRLSRTGANVIEQ